MSMTVTNNQSSMYVTGGGNFRNSTVKGNPPSFVGKVYTREELLQSAEREVRQNEDKKLSLADMIKNSCFEGTRAKFRFAGESKVYAFGEYVQELEKRFGKEDKGWQ